MSDAARALAALGFSDLEAAVYVAVLSGPDRTGYAVARELGKATANTYKAIESLARKGALLDDGGDPRCFRAVPAEELLGRLRADFGTRVEDAARALERLDGDGPDDRIYRLRGDAAQVYERARSMIAGAKLIVIADLFPTPLSELADELLAAVDRGVEIFVRAYEEDRLPPIPGIIAWAEPRMVAALPGDHLGLVVDANRHLFALLDRGSPRVLQAVWSASPYLSCLAYNHLAQEWRVASARAGQGADQGPPSILVTGEEGFGRLQALCSP